MKIIEQLRKAVVCGVAVAFPLFMQGCIQDEPQNSEADILQCVLTDDYKYLITKSDTLMNITSITNNITIYVTPDCDMTKLAPRFILTDGATISPASGSVHDFSDNKLVTYTVTSENGLWSRKYNVGYSTVMEFPLHLDFEKYILNTKNQYHIFYEVVDSVDVMSWWSSGNPGFCLAAASAGPEDYPTVSVEDGYDNRGVKLTTRYAGSFGKAAGMPIAAGNLFLGSFDVQQALRSPLTATRFGVIFTHEPDSIVGYYKYKPGPQMRDGKYKPIDGVDDYNIYAILYENTDSEGNTVMLDGTNSLNSEFLVLYGQVADENRKSTDEWTRFSFPMTQMNGKTVDADRLKKYGYNFAIVFTSSRNGDNFTGAVGSELWVDQVEIKCKETGNENKDGE